MKTLLSLITGFILVAFFPIEQIFAADIRVGQMTILNPWARGSFSKAKSASAYMFLKNEGRKTDQLISISSGITQKAKLHNTQSKDGVIKMNLVKELDIPNGSLVVLKPGGLHIMLFGLSKPLIEGDYFRLTLEFAKAGIKEVMFKVLKPGTLENKEMNHQKH